MKFSDDLVPLYLDKDTEAGPLLDELTKLAAKAVGHVGREFYRQYPKTGELISLLDRLKRGST